MTTETTDERIAATVERDILRAAIEQAVADLSVTMTPDPLAKGVDRVLGDLRRALES